MFKLALSLFFLIFLINCKLNGENLNETIQVIDATMSDDVTVATTTINTPLVNLVDSLTTSTTTEKPPQQIINHYLKWITNQTRFPMKLSIKIDPKEVLDESYSYDWLRLKDETLVTHLPNLFKDYLVTESDESTNLYVLKYDADTNEQLASYEPLLIHKNKDTKVLSVVNTGSNVKHVFSLAYLKKHAFNVETVEASEDKKVTCYADFMVAKPSYNSSNNHKNFLNSVMRQMQKSSKFTLRYRENGMRDALSLEKKGFNFIGNPTSQQRFPTFLDRPLFQEPPPTFNPLVHENQGSRQNKIFYLDEPQQQHRLQPPHQPMPQQRPPQPIQPQQQPPQQMNPQQQSPQPMQPQQRPPQQMNPHQQPLQPMQPPQPIQPQQQQEHWMQPPHQKPQQMPPHQQQVQYSYSTDFQKPGLPHVFDNINYNYNGPLYHNLANSIRSSVLRNAYNQFNVLPYIYPSTLQLMQPFRLKRNDGSRQKSEFLAEDLNYDSDKLFKIRISLGPISIKEYFNGKTDSVESVECNLSLVSPGESDYFLSTINQIINKKEVDNSWSVHQPNPIFHQTQIEEIQKKLIEKSFYGPNNLQTMSPPPPEINDQVEHKEKSKDHLFMYDRPHSENQHQGPVKLGQHVLDLGSSASSTKIAQFKLIILLFCFLNSFFFFFL